MRTYVKVQGKPCPGCGKQETLTVTREGLVAWRDQNAMIQEAFPDLSADQRELLVTGYCPKCWDEDTGEEE